MKRRSIIILAIIIGAVAIAAFFLFFRKEKKVEFSKIQEKSGVENSDTPAENTGLENATENDPAADSSTPKVVEDKDKTATEVTENKKDEPANNMNITNKLASWGYEKAGSRKIDTIIVHSTYNITSSDPFDLDAIIYKEYKPYGVAPHYIIDRDGKIYRLVEDKNIAYHAGESKMPDGRTGVNNFSIGIELVNSKTAKPTSEQYASLKYLIGYIKGKYSIKYTLGHKDIAAGRKDDPWNFDWGKIK